TFWSIDVGTGEVKNLGPTAPDLVTPPPPTRYQCDYAKDANGDHTTYKITDTQTGDLTVIENVYTAWPYCPADDDPTLRLWRSEADKTLAPCARAYASLVAGHTP